MYAQILPKYGDIVTATRWAAAVVAVAAASMLVGAGSAQAATKTVSAKTVSSKTVAVKTVAVNISETFSKVTNGTYTDGGTFSGTDRWNVNFAGYGAVKTVRQAPSFTQLTPQVSTGGQTHAALVTSQKVLTAPCTTINARLRTATQLRTGATPNPWETAWLVWDFVDNDHFTYLAAKPNGWELGKRDPAYPGGQRFLATGPTTTAIGSWVNTTVVRKAGTNSATLTVSLNGKQVGTVTDMERPYTSGKLGMYTEDAQAEFDTIKTSTC